jgi:hypothetical protein
MKSVALILWLALANGKEQVIHTRHLEDMDTCRSIAQAMVENHANKGERVRFLCHEVIEEAGDVDENGNPL